MNVLDYLDPIIRDPHSGEPIGMNEDMCEARDAVAELIEADKEYDAANLSGHCYRIADATVRRREALANVEKIK